jgi:hypothetical protein
MIAVLFELGSYQLFLKTQNKYCKHFSLAYLYINQIYLYYLVVYKTFEYFFIVYN